MSLRGKRVALLEARMSGELSSMVERLGGTPYSVPAVRETPLEQPEETARFIDSLAVGRFDVVVFMTGVGATALLREAEKLGRLEAVLAALRTAITVCRGPKPVAVLRRHDVQVNATAAEPHTTTELLQSLDAIGVSGKSIALVHYGERNETAAGDLRQRGASLDEICLYEWRLPDDTAPLERLVNEIIDGRLDAIAVTSQIQIRHLFQIADGLGRADALTDALSRKLVVAAVGPVCASALRARGVVPHVQPSHPKMGPMLIALADYFDLTGQARS
ncbi:MAG TPA: uroporphyrinogen-III synthase [Vicinamibacterales bacterium]|nr:uroporphyrinogen-III synthase [Vicinamibacterales bacterium]